MGKLCSFGSQNAVVQRTKIEDAICWPVCAISTSECLAFRTAMTENKVDTRHQNQPALLDLISPGYKHGLQGARSGRQAALRKVIAKWDGGIARNSSINARINLHIAQVRKMRMSLCSVTILEREIVSVSVAQRDTKPGAATHLVRHNGHSRLVAMTSFEQSAHMARWPQSTTASWASASWQTTHSPSRSGVACGPVGTAGARGWSVDFRPSPSE